MNIIRDIEVDDDGDLVIGSNGDLKLASTLDTAIQDIIMRIRTNYMEMQLHPSFGANMQAKYGLPNTAENADWIRSAITMSLLRDERFGPGEVSVEVVPVAVDELLVLVVLNSIGYDQPVSSEQEVLSFSWNYNDGTIERITD